MEDEELDHTQWGIRFVRGFFFSLEKCIYYNMEYEVLDRIHWRTHFVRGC
jgi:hypothetical protein